MGRNKTGAITNSSAIRIELSYLLKNGYIKRGYRVCGTLGWTNGGEISIESIYKANEAYVKLVYSNTNQQTGTITKHDYRVNLTAVPSNLGVGEVLYFSCPETGEKCRILYKCYGSLIWKSRLAYSSRIYYDCQICSKLYYHTERYFALRKRFKSIKRPLKSHYKGRVTRTAIQYQRVEGLKDMHDIKRWQIFDKYMNK